MQRYFSGLLIFFFFICTFATVTFAKDQALKISYMRLPLSFIQNYGQKDPSVIYYEQGRGHFTAFTKEGVSLVLTKFAKIKDKKQTSESVTLIPLDSSSLKIEGIDRKEGKINYLIGDDQKQWKTNISSYGTILLKNVYPGIDMKFYGTNSQLESNIIILPNADPSKIRLSCSGAEKVSLMPTGDLNISLKKGTILQKKPSLSQTINGDTKEIEGRITVAGNSYSFKIGAYDKNQPLIINQVLVFSQYLGGNNSDIASATTIDSKGNAYVTGITDSTNFPTQNPYQRSPGGSVDAFVTKLSPSGDTLVYSTYLGGSGWEDARAIAVDSSGNAYVTGITDSANFPTQVSNQVTDRRSFDPFVTKLCTDVGTIGTKITKTGTGFGSKKGEVFLGSAATKIISWTDSSITCEITKPLLPGTHTITIKPKEKKSSPIANAGEFTIMAPEILLIDPNSGGSEWVIVISGNYFGTKKPTVYVGAKKCKVSSWAMDRISFIVPKNMASGSYDVTVTNEVGSVSLADGFTIH